MPTKGNLGQDPNSQESARSSQSYISNLVVIPVEEGINPVQLNTDPTPQPEDFFILTKPDGTSYKTTLDAIQGVNSGALSLDVTSANDTVTQTTPSSFNPTTREITVDLTVVPQVNADWDATTGVSEILNKPGTATELLSGLVQLATQAEVIAGINTTKAVVPSTLAGALNSGLLSAAFEDLASLYMSVGATANLSPGFQVTQPLSYANLKTTPCIYAGKANEVFEIGVSAATYQNAITFDPAVPGSRPMINNLGGGYQPAKAIATLGDITDNGIGIIASGSNANGKWVKYADGFIQQWGINAVTNSGYTIFTYPIPFEVASSVATVLTAVTPATETTGYVAILSTTNFNRFGFLCGTIALSSGLYVPSYTFWQAEGY